MYATASTVYQSILVIAGFLFGPAICRAMVVSELTAGPSFEALCRSSDVLAGGQSVRKLPITLFEHPQPFVLTAGLFPRQNEIFISSELVDRLGQAGLRFQIARATVHGSASQRLVALVPVVVLTVLYPSSFDLMSSLYLALFLLAWLGLHWLSELAVDRRAARMMGEPALGGLMEMLAATGALGRRFSLQPPLQWRVAAVSGNA